MVSSSDENEGASAPVEPSVPSEPPESVSQEGPAFSIAGLGSSAPERDYWRIGGGIFAGLLLVAIIVFSVTDLSEGFLPMDDRYLEILIPETEEGVRPLALDEIGNMLEDNRISVSGRVTNESLESVENVVAVITASETTGRFPETIEVPVQPSVLEPGETGDFSVAVPLRQKPDSSTVRFKLENGPFVPHSDARGPSINFLEAP